MWRTDETAPWTSLQSASSWGAERLNWPTIWWIGHNPRGPLDAPFVGRDLQISTFGPVCQTDHS